MKWTLTGAGLLAGAMLALAAPEAAQAQSQGYGGTGQLQAGYGGARYTTGRPVSGTTRDANGNRLIVNGIIQSGVGAYSSSSGGASATGSWGLGGDGRATIGGSTAIGNQLNVVVQGNHNTVIVNSTQTNSGDVRAGTALNGRLDLR
ncbi:MAG TPA: holdfast anchoring protein HfaA [Brevundimonas sp.]|jgi:holdfast attachment protein HfaA|uniref:holdfast anchoring protein HfaA n=1 Tax=Brevundimonas sp. TaxID=1871086 RepID=UPI002DE78FEA|nr:holdfast anchoring protein HfaA [Brevundimonas sp.]